MSPPGTARRCILLGGIEPVDGKYKFDVPEWTARTCSDCARGTSSLCMERRYIQPLDSKYSFDVPEWTIASPDAEELVQGWLSLASARASSPERAPARGAASK
mmetsp:Transcript_100639/g.267511  ORF Transcript_100639/g.267511 Transcript_100639/m.267511 type:complete len:103 (+) Transcript_100639:2428-2736(+)